MENLSLPMSPRLKGKIDEVLKTDGIRLDSDGELRIHYALKKIFPEHKFVKGSPDFLTCPRTDNKLEYDFFNEELKLAIEYNGIHHYEWPNWTALSLEKFTEQFLRDQAKYDLSFKNGIYLIVIPYTVPKELIEENLIARLKNCSVLEKRVPVV